MATITQRRAVAIFAALASAYFLSALIRAITATLAPTLVVELSLNAADLGLLAGGYFIGFSATQLPLGTWLDRYGPKRVELAFLAVAVIGCVAFSMARSFEGLLLARILCGVGVSACLMAPLTGYRRWYAPANQMRANSWMLMIGAFGMVASTLPVQWLLPVTGWRPIFLMLAVAVALSMLAIAWQLPAWDTGGTSNKDAPPSGPPPGYGQVWSNRYFRSLAPLGFFSYGGLVAMQTLWAAPWMVRVAGYTPVEAANGLFWINVAMLGTYWLWGLANPWLARRGYSADLIIARGMPPSFIILAALAYAGDSITGAAALVWTLFCVASSVCSIAQPAVGMAFRAELAGRALSAYNLVIFCGVFAVQWGVGLCIDALRAQGWTEVAAFQGSMGIYAACCFGAYLYFIFAKKT